MMKTFKMPEKAELKKIADLAQQARYATETLRDELLLSHRFDGYDDFSVAYHWHLAHEKLEKLARRMGYRIEKIEEKPAEQYERDEDGIVWVKEAS
jgi:glycine betaine/choline ABC-type transport system substrate-binding protein